MKPALAIILGRAGSQGLPGKNALPLVGRPMVCHSIAHAQAACCVDRVIVSTDGPAIAAAAHSMNVPVIDRPADLADDTAPVGLAARHALETDGSPHEVILILYANVPVRPAHLIDRAVTLLIESGCDSVQSYADVGKHHPHWMVRLDEAGRIAPLVEGHADRRQDLPRVYIPDGGVIAVRRACLLRADRAQPHGFLGEDRRGVTTAPGDVIDVDTPADFAVAEAALRATQSAAPPAGDPRRRPSCGASA